MINFCCIFTKLKNFELNKEVGQIPYYLAKEQGYNSTMITFDNDTFTNFKQTDEINLKILEKKFKIDFMNNFLVVRYLMKNAKNIDVLNCYHYTLQTFMFFLFYKIFNRKGIVYLTIDTDYPTALRLNGKKKGLRYKFETIMSVFLFKHLIDFATIESKKAYEVFAESDDIYKEKIRYMPIFVDPNPSIECEKKNQIISVGRIGAHQKASEIVLETFKRTVEKLNTDEWILKLVGPVSEDFENYLNNFLNSNPHLKDLIVVTGNIEDRDELYKTYSQAKIFFLPSRYGSFEIVFCEALFYNDYLIITDVGTGKYVVDISDFGKIVEIDNIDVASVELIDAINNYDKYAENNTKDFKKLVIDEFGHEHHVKNLSLTLNNIKNKKL